MPTRPSDDGAGPSSADPQAAEPSAAAMSEDEEEEAEASSGGDEDEDGDGASEEEGVRAHRDVSLAHPTAFVAQSLRVCGFGLTPVQRLKFVRILLQCCELCHKMQLRYIRVS